MIRRPPGRKIGQLRPVGFDWATAAEGPWRLLRDGLGREIIPTGFQTLLELHRLHKLEGRARAYAEHLVARLQEVDAF